MTSWRIRLLSALPVTGAQAGRPVPVKADTALKRSFAAAGMPFDKNTAV
ncbi:MAG: hypothetical protein K5841_10870 [Fretibacterium sp.]|nr:hypothetical protein [Fretibacterium sp.]